MRSREKDHPNAFRPGAASVPGFASLLCTSSRRRQASSSKVAHQGFPKGPEVEARHAVAAEARLPDFLLAVLNFDDASRVGLLEPLLDLVEQSSDGIAPLLDHGLPGLAFSLMLLGLLAQELSKVCRHG